MILFFYPPLTWLHILQIMQISFTSSETENHIRPNYESENKLEQHYINLNLHLVEKSEKFFRHLAKIRKLQWMELHWNWFNLNLGSMSVFGIGILSFSNWWNYYGSGIMVKFVTSTIILTSIYSNVYWYFHSLTESFVMYITVLWNVLKVLLLLRCNDK